LRAFWSGRGTRSVIRDSESRVNGFEKDIFLKWFVQIIYGVFIFGPSRGEIFFMGRDEDGGERLSRSVQPPLEFPTAHLLHPEVEDQTGWFGTVFVTHGEESKPADPSPG
jgi:hypothetical protein